MDFTVELPGIGTERVAVHARADAARHVRHGHPWLWDGSVERSPASAMPGDLAVIFDERRRFVGIGLYDPVGPISVRVLHGGRPATIDDDFFASRVLAAVAQRSSLLDDHSTTGLRLIHGENDRLPGLVIDLYATTLVARLDTVAWLPHLPAVLRPVGELIDIDRVVLRTSRRIESQLPAGFSNGMALVGTVPDAPIPFLEHGLVFEADVVHGQKTGHFLDQRDNRQLVARRARDADVLDVFCNTGGFSVHAAAAGARRVTSIDQSPHAIAATQRHLELNRMAIDSTFEHRTITGDAFDELERLADQRQRFDVVILDPPSFAPNTASIPAARRAYRRLTSLGIELLGSGGTLFQASCSSRIDAVEFHDLIADELERAGRKAVHEIRTAHALDHPIGFGEGAYLKAMIADVHLRG